MNNKCLVFFLVLFSYVLGAYAEEKSVLNHAILLTVNSRQITRKNLDDMGLILFRMNFPERPLDGVTPEEIDRLSSSALRELVILNLVEDELDVINSDKIPENDVRVSEMDIEQQIEMYRLQKFDTKQLTQRFGSYQAGMSSMINARAAGFTPRPKQIFKFYKKHKDTLFTERREIKLRHIYMSMDPINPETTKRQTRMIYEDIQEVPAAKRVDAFAKAAKDFSQDRFAASGGIVPAGPGGWFPQDHDFIGKDGKSMMPPEMLQSIRSLNARGEMVHFKSKNGWHILLLEDIKGGRKIPFKKIRKFIEEYLSNELFEKEKSEWLEMKVKRSRILWNDGDEFPQDQILTGIDEEQRLQMLRERIQYALQNNRR